ncbi:GNAT family N-acetyltransferase [Bacillus shivajii]|uniref:GNAT family N-acetyltransferase n=1 Tax=Bacillus shivajii TaxID=1983719 RepID=UPI001CFA7622|nr:GNAT family N-acetyltransferase [Bacillus shivajii]UCZ55204.1 GNAT family N-acetyltransferase [Bacillus shivajii]
MVRKATLEDLSAIQKIARETWHDTYDGLIPRDIQDKFVSRAYSDENMALRVEKTVLFVAEIKGEVVGFANFFRRESEEAELGAIYIYPVGQGKGIGSKLLDAGIHELHNVSKLFVEVEKGNESGERFYEAKGFEVVKEYDEDFYGHMLKTKQLILKL